MLKTLLALKTHHNHKLPLRLSGDAYYDMDEESARQEGGAANDDDDVMDHLWGGPRAL